MDKKYKSKKSVEKYSNSIDEEYKKEKKHDKKKKKKKREREQSESKSKKYEKHKKDKNKKNKRKKKYDDSDEDIKKSNTTSATSLSFLCEGYDSLNEKLYKYDSSNSIEKHKDMKKKNIKNNKKEEEYKKHQESKQSEQFEKEEFKDKENENEATDDDTDSIGPKPLDINVKLANKQMDYGGAMMPGEGKAIAQFIQKGKRIPRRGEVGLSAEAIENFENIGYVMSGSRHKRMNAIRMRKENQVYSAEEQRALAMFNYEERANRENALITDLKEILRKQNETILNDETNDT
ncbi:Ras-induced vulval development antagonist, putative [Plasmodium berghei]|nr:Ras-induced vulval development antagonist, putative [Plasmodium berghei]